MRSTFASWLEKGGRGQVIKQQQQQQQEGKEWLKEKETNLEKLSFTTFFSVSLLLANVKAAPGISSTTD